MKVLVNIHGLEVPQLTWDCPQRYQIRKYIVSKLERYQLLEDNRSRACYLREPTNKV